MTAPELLHLGAHPPRIGEHAAVGDDHEAARPMQGAAQGVVEGRPRRRFLFAEEHRETALAQASREVAGVASRAARRRAERKGDEEVPAVEERRVLGPRLSGGNGWH